VNNVRSPEPSVEAAMALVLAAQQDARSSIEAARLQAAALAEQARSDARALTERTQRRTVKLRATFLRQTLAEVAAIDAESRALAEEHRPDADELLRLQTAAQTLAAQLTGATP
jgi:hypothetical protein